MVYDFHIYSDGIFFSVVLAMLSFRFRCVRKMFVTTTVLISSCLSAWKRASATRWISFKFHISNFYQNLFTRGKITDTLYKDLLSL